ncbi:cytochrome P450 [Amniculicola lignicola CBS 123094]|uniref:Cytochrome P450 n=1 Tax=Amniculicola lignicola CBS 123094 TaxID=1392246 RepID=A0A6A5W1S4_9PLEO|nr:cytochrome P450 [Amniculicola lignicola CBS 123094]
MGTIDSFPAIIFTFAPLWVTWWLWRFVISPTLYPSRPKILPYYIPWLGHVLPFIRDNNRLITRARLYFGNTREPFALVLGGQYVYILTSSKDVTTCFQNPKDLTFDAYIEDMQLRFGGSQPAVKAIWTVPSPEDLEKRKNEGGYPNPHGRHLVHLSETIFKAQLHPGARLNKLSITFLGIIHDRMNWGSTPDSLIRGRNQTDTERIVSLKGLIQHALLYAATMSFFGQAIFRVDPKIMDYFAAFDEDSWQFTYQVPEFFSRKMIIAKRRAQRVFDEYFNLPQSERADSCWMVQTLEKEMLAAGTKSKDISAYLMMFYWVLNGNAWKATFWLASHIIFNSELNTLIEDEVRPLFLGSAEPSPEEVMGCLNNMPVLSAAYNEALRICTSSITVRDVLKDCTVGRVSLQKGSRLLIPYKQMLLDEHVFGSDPESFQVGRFLEKPELAKDPSSRSFGGGITYCPGRFLAQKEILTLIGILFGRYEIRLHGGQHFPRMEMKKPCLGIVGPVEGEDFIVQMKRI